MTHRISSHSAGRAGGHDPAPSGRAGVSGPAQKVESFLFRGTFKAYGKHSANAKAWVKLYCNLKAAKAGLKPLIKQADHELAEIQSRYLWLEEEALSINAQLADFACLRASPHAAHLLYEKIEGDAVLAQMLKVARLERSDKELAGLRDEKQDCEHKLEAARARLEELETRRAHAKSKAKDKSAKHRSPAHVEPSRDAIRAARNKVANLESDIATLAASIDEARYLANERNAVLAPFRQAVADLASGLRAAGVSEQEETAIKPLMLRLDEVYEHHAQLHTILEQAELSPICLDTGEVLFFGLHSAAQLKDLLATVRAELLYTEQFITADIKRLKLSRTREHDRWKPTRFRPLQATYDYSLEAGAEPEAPAWQVAADDGDHLASPPCGDPRSPVVAPPQMREDAPQEPEAQPAADLGIESPGTPSDKAHESSAASEAEDSEDSVETSEEEEDSDDEQVSDNEEGPRLPRSPSPAVVAVAMPDAGQASSSQTMAHSQAPAGSVGQDSEDSTDVDDSEDSVESSEDEDDSDDEQVSGDDADARLPQDLPEPEPPRPPAPGSLPRRILCRAGFGAPARASSTNWPRTGPPAPTGAT
ncbi:hypothetical protein E2I21_11380 [Alcaligenaceae bacterium SAGV5]|nr:hypothetical protein [Alcaligenaceae bacterium SAGV5]